MPDLAPQLRARTKERAVFGTFVKLGRREVIEILANAGLDFAICDLEHSQISEQEASIMILAGLACDLPVMVRVADFQPGLINRLMESGSAGIQLVGKAADHALTYSELPVIERSRYPWEI